MTKQDKEKLNQEVQSLLHEAFRSIVDTGQVSEGVFLYVNGFIPEKEGEEVNCVEMFYPSSKDYGNMFGDSIGEVRRNTGQLFPPVMTKLLAARHSEAFIEQLRTQIDFMCKVILDTDDDALSDEDYIAARHMMALSDSVRDLHEHMVVSMEPALSKLRDYYENRKGGSDE